MSAHEDPLDNSLLLGRYRVVRLLGEGGMGTVHLARVEGAEGFTRPVVVKRMKREIRSSDEGNKLFIREAKILSKMQHPSIVGISDFGIEDGAHIMVLEYVHGYSLSAWLDYRHELGEPLPVDVCLFIVRRILDALHYAHHFDTEEGQEIEIVHRDVAPDNVLVSNRGYVHLLDFGVASMRGPQGEASTKAGSFRGKLGYAAPETVHGQSATPRSDQYSTGVVLLELLTHEVPFLADSMGETVVRMVGMVPEPPSQKRGDVPPGLDDVVARALAKNPEERFESALELSRALRKLQRADDEEITQQLKELVRHDFDLLPKKIEVEDLRQRDAALSRMFSTPPRAAVTAHTLLAPGGSPPAEPSPPTSQTSASGEGHAPMMIAAPPAPAPQGQLRGLLWGLLVVGGCIALGLGAAVAFLARGGNASEVVVVGGERSSEVAAAEGGGDAAADSREARTDSTESADSASPATQPAAANDAPRGADEGARTPTSETRAQRPKARPTLEATKKTSPLQQRLSSSVQGQSGAFQQCFTSHVAAGGKAETARLHFSVDRAGGKAQVKVEPPALAGTPLGKCLERAASQVRFPPLEKDVSFRLPVRPRVARREDSK